MSYPLLETYKDIGSLAAGLHEYRLELMNTDAVTSHLSPVLVSKCLSSSTADDMIELIALAASPHLVELRKAILAFILSKPPLAWVLKGSDEAPPSSTSGQIGNRNPAPDDFYTYFKDAETFNTAVSQHMSELITSRQLSAMIPPQLRIEYANDPAQKATAFTRFLLAQANPDLYRAVSEWIKGRPGLRYLLQRRRNDFYTYFKDADSFNTAMSQHMKELMMSRNLHALIPPARRVDFLNNTVQTAVAFTRFLFSQADPDLYNAVRDWIKGRPGLHFLLEMHSDDFHTYFKDVDSFNTAMSQHMNELTTSPQLSTLLAPAHRVDFSDNTAQTAAAFTQFLFSQANPGLYKAVRDWIRGRPDLRFLLNMRSDDFHTYFKDVNSFNAAISQHMNELIMSPRLAMLLAPTQRFAFSNNTVQTAVAFTRFLFSQANPDLYEAVREWIKGRPGLAPLLETP